LPGAGSSSHGWTCETAIRSGARANADLSLSLWSDPPRSTRATALSVSMSHSVHDELQRFEERRLRALGAPYLRSPHNPLMQAETRAMLEWAQSRPPARLGLDCGSGSYSRLRRRRRPIGGGMDFCVPMLRQVSAVRGCAEDDAAALRHEAFDVVVYGLAAGSRHRVQAWIFGRKSQGARDRDGYAAVLRFSSPKRARRRPSRSLKAQKRSPLDRAHH